MKRTDEISNGRRREAQNHEIQHGKEMDQESGNETDKGQDAKKQKYGKGKILHNPRNKRKLHAKKRYTRKKTNMREQRIRRRESWASL